MAIEVDTLNSRTGARNAAGLSYDTAYLCPLPRFGSWPWKTDRKSRGYEKDELTAWARGVLSDGRSYLRLQPAYPYIQDGMDLVNGENLPSPIQALSNAKTEMTNRALRELIAAQTNIRIIPVFRSEAVEFRQQTKVLNDCFMAWQSMTMADRSIRKAWQYACFAGTGYLHLRYDPDYYYRGKGDLVLDAYGPNDFLPVGLSRQHDIQSSYIGALHVEMPIHQAWRRWPAMADEIRASRENSKGKGTVVAQSVKFASAALRRWGPDTAREHEPATWEMVDFYYIYVDDDSINTSGREITLGTRGTSWEYTVPYVGQDIPSRDPNDLGRPIKAKEDDCRLYPLGRLVVCDSDGLTMNPKPEDQVNPHWHGNKPVIQFRADDWPHLFLGFPITRYGQNLEKANVELLRGMVDCGNVRLNPPRAFDRNTQSAALMEAMNLRVPNQVIGLDLTFGSGEPVKPFLDPRFYEYPATVPALMMENEGRIKYQMGVPDAQALATAKQLPAGDSLEKMLAMMGPLIKDQARNMESSITRMGNLWKSDWLQFTTAARHMQILGPDELPEEEFDYDPGTLVPMDAPPSHQFILNTQQFERARWHKDNFIFQVHPYSLHEFNSMTRKLFYLQLQRSGFPIDWWTLADLFDIRNFGPAPSFTDPETGDMKTAQTVMERITVQWEMELRKAQALAQAAGGGGGGKGGGKGQKGRPPTAQTPPALEQKSGAGGTRAVVRESSHS